MKNTLSLALCKCKSVTKPILRVTSAFPRLKSLSLFLLLFLVIGAGNAFAVDFSASSDKGSVSTNGTTSGGDHVTKSGVTITSSNGPMGNGTDYRVYQNGTFVISSTAGNITKIEMTFTASGTSNYGPSKISATGYTYSGNKGTWEGTAAASVSFSATAQARITAITVTLASGGGTPTLSSISVSTAPTKTTYTEGETFDPTGLVITRNYSNSTSDTYTYANHTSDFSFTPTTSTALTTADDKVTITYGGKTVDQAITVNSSGGGAGTGTINFGSATGSTKIDGISVTGDDNLGNTWTISTVMSETSFTQSSDYSQVGSSKKPATSITFEMDLSEAMNITAFSAKFGGFGGTAGDITLEIDGDEVGSGTLNETDDVIASALAENLPVTGSTLTVTVTNIAKGVKCYYISYTCEEASTDPTIKATPTSLTGFTANYGGGASESKTISVSGKNLTGNLTVSIPSNADFQISSNGSTWGNSLTLTQSAGTVAATTIYVRMKSGLGVGDHSGTITISGGGAVSKEVVLSGSVVVECSTPTLEFNGNPTNIDKQVGDTKFTIAATATGNTLGAAITYSSDKTSKASVDPNTGEVTIKEATGSGAPVTITATLAYTSTSTACQNEVTATYTITIYNKVTWLVNGISHTTGNPTQQTLQGGTIDAYPSDPDGSSVCGGKVFKGWTNAEYSGDNAPPTLYTSLSDMSSIHITQNTTYYAVFATRTPGTGTSATYEFSITEDDFDGTGYASNNGSHTSTAEKVDEPSITIDVDWTSNQVAESPTDGWTQWQKTNGYIYNTTDLGKINSVTVNDKEGSFTTYYGSSEHPTSETSLGSADGYFTVQTGSTMAGQTSSVVVNFTKSTGTPDTYSEYSTTCGPTIKAGAVEYLTSTSGQTVKSQEISIKGSSLIENGTLSYSISGVNKDYFTCTLASNVISATGAIETTVIISYTPTVYGQTHEASITFSDGTTISDPITLRGRSLPEQFAIVASDGTSYYVLDGSMSGTASLVEPLRVEVSAGAVVSCPSRAVYSLTELETPDQNVYLVGPAGRLWGSKTGSDLNTKSLTSTSQTAWLLTTSDGITYHITNAEPTANRGVMYNSSSYYFGHYATSNYGKSGYYGDLQFLPITTTCTCLNSPKPTVIARSQTATLTWSEILDAVGYVVTCSGGTVTVTGTTATITGLAQSTEYNYTIKSVAAGNDCSTTRHGSFTTTDCDDVPSGISITAGTKTATIKWNASVSIATIRIYSAPEATDGDEITELRQTDVGSPCTISGLEENTTYYAKIFAGGSCVSTVQMFTTQSTAVELAEWKMDGINIYLNADELTASVLIEDKLMNVTTTENFADSIFFSKYFEADGENKMLAIYNGTRDTFDLSNYNIQRTERTGKRAAKTYTVELSHFGNIKPGYICPSEEIIIVRYAGTNSAEECLTDGDGHETWVNATNMDAALGYGETAPKTFMNFSGPMSIGLYSKTAHKFIDVIGASTSADGTGDLVQIDASNSSSCTYAKYSTTYNDNPGGFYVLDGDNYQTEDEEHDYFLSTNRCLLIRNNKVTSGLNAVQKNVYSGSFACDCDADIVKSFVTLSYIEEEWRGFQIGSGSGASTHSLTCEGMADVGTFDYNAYYAKFDSLTTADDLWGARNPDGTYHIDIPQLDTLSCNMLRIKVYEGEELKVSREYKVPIMISENTTTTTSEIFRNYGKDKDVCKTCDVVILGNAILTKDADGANDVPEVRDVKIYPGGKLVVPSGREYSVSSLTLRREEDAISKADIRGTLNLTAPGDENIFFDLRIDPTNWHYVALPYDCNIGDVTFSNGNPAVQNVDFFVKWYDGEERATNLSGGWKHVQNGVMRKGQGYIVGLAGSGTEKRELRFPMANTILTEEVNPSGKSVGGVYAFGGDKTMEELRPNHRGWNLIGNPYLTDYAVDFGDMLRTGYLVRDPESPNLWTIQSGTGGIKYIVSPVGNGRAEYVQKTLSAENMKPFTAYFIQLGGSHPDQEQAIVYNQSGRQSIARRHTSTNEDDNHPVWCAVTLTNANGEQDETTFLVSDNFTNGYDMMDDLVKMRGTKYSSYSKPVLASRNDEGEMAFNALPDSTARLGIPLNYYAAASGQYTIALDGRYSLEEVTGAQLYDSKLQIWHNLMTENYTFAATREDNTTRFKLYLTVERKQPQTPTEAGNIYGKLTLTANDRTLILSGIREHADVYVYDISGKLIDSGSHVADGDNGVWRTTVPTQGVYFVRVKIGTEQQTLNTIVY